MFKIKNFSPTPPWQILWGNIVVTVLSICFSTAFLRFGRYEITGNTKISTHYYIKNGPFGDNYHFLLVNKFDNEVSVDDEIVIKNKIFTLSGRVLFTQMQQNDKTQILVIYNFQKNSYWNILGNGTYILNKSFYDCLKKR